MMMMMMIRHAARKFEGMYTRMLTSLTANRGILTANQGISRCMHTTALVRMQDCHLLVRTNLFLPGMNTSARTPPSSISIPSSLASTTLYRMAFLARICIIIRL